MVLATLRIRLMKHHKQVKLISFSGTMASFYCTVHVEHHVVVFVAGLRFISYIRSYHTAYSELYSCASFTVITISLLSFIQSRSLDA